MTATIRRVPRARGDLTADQQRAITRARTKADKSQARAEQDAAEYRAAVVQALDEGASFAMLAEFTGHSTNTLQAWKKAAK